MNEYTEITKTRQVYTGADTGIPGLYLLGRDHKLHADPPIPAHLHRNRFELAVITKGEQIFKFGDRSYTLSAGDYVISLPNEIHDTSDSPAGRTDLYWFQLDFGAERIFMLSESDTEKLKEKLLNVKQFGRLPSFDQDLLRFAADAMSASLTSLPGVYLLLLLERLCVRSEENKSSVSVQIALAQEYIRKNINDPISLYDVAKSIGLSLSRFKGRFKAETGVSPHEFVMIEKVRAAKIMLKSGKSVTDTAYDMSFSSSNYFATVFKKYTSMTPIEYIRSKSRSGLSDI